MPRSLNRCGFIGNTKSYTDIYRRGEVPPGCIFKVSASQQKFMRIGMGNHANRGGTGRYTGKCLERPCRNNDATDGYYVVVHSSHRPIKGRLAGCLANWRYRRRPTHLKWPPINCDDLVWTDEHDMKLGRPLSVLILFHRG